MGTLSPARGCLPRRAASSLPDHKKSQPITQIALSRQSTHRPVKETTKIGVVLSRSTSAKYAAPPVTAQLTATQDYIGLHAQHGPGRERDQKGSKGITEAGSPSRPLPSSCPTLCPILPWKIRRRPAAPTPSSLPAPPVRPPRGGRFRQNRLLPWGDMTMRAHPPPGALR